MSSNAGSIYSQRNLKTPNRNEQNEFYEFDRFRLDAAHLMLYENEAPVSLAPKVIETLLALIERSGEVVGKEELMARLWSDSFVEEANLTQNVYLLRKTLGNASNGEPLIETFRRRGYRFNGEIRSLGAVSVSGRVLPESEDDLGENISDDSNGRLRPMKKTATPFTIVIGGLIVVLVLGIGYAAWRFAATRDAATPSVGITLKRLTPDIYAYNPAISPDGRYLAYSEIRDEKQSIWIKEIELDNPKQLLPLSVMGYKGLQFSPDGTQLYYLTRRENEPNNIIARIPIVGGTPFDIARNSISPAAISPDGRRLAFIDGLGNLMTINTDGSDELLLAARDAKTKWFEGWDSQMSWAPDGTKLAVCGGYSESGQRRYELIEVSAADGTERRIPTPPDWREMDDVVWLSGGNELLVTVRESQGQPYQIWRLSYASGETRRVTNDLNDYNYFTVTADSRLIVAEQFLGNVNIWMGDAGEMENARQLTFGKAARDGLSGIAVLPDGKIVFSSTRSGNVDLWSMDETGANQRQLTANVGTSNSRPQATTDGRYIVFSSSRTGTSNIWRMDSDGGNPKQLTFGIYETRPALSPDGKWVYYTEGEGSTSSFISRVSIDGGEPTRISEHNQAWAPAASPDGKWIAYNHNEVDAPNPWKAGVMRAAGGEPLLTFDLNVYRGVLGWASDSKSILYITRETANIWQQPLNGGRPRAVTNFPTERIVHFAFSPDYKHIAFSRGSLSTEVVLITYAR